jgi:hypothetical protein
VQIVRPDLDPDGHDFLFQQVDKCGDGSIDIFDFLGIGPIISQRLATNPEVIVQQYGERVAREHPKLNRIRLWCQTIIEWRFWDTFILYLLFIHFLLFCVHWYNIPTATTEAIYAAKNSIVGLYSFYFSHEVFIFRFVCEFL